MTPTSASFGNLLRQLRRERGLSQLELAVDAAVSSRHLCFLETGRAKPSEMMVSRLASAMDLETSCFDDLRTAAGFCARSAERSAGIGSRIFESALMMEGAHTAAQIVEAGQAILPELGIVQFFFGTLSCERSARPGFDWANFGAFPGSWLHRYDRERYAMTDPLLAVVRARGGGFFWDEVIDRRSLAGPAREMFERAEAGGVSAGFVTSRRRSGSIQIVSMMGTRVDRHNQTARVGLEMLGSRMLVDLDRLGALNGGYVDAAGQARHQHPPPLDLPMPRREATSREDQNV